MNDWFTRYLPYAQLVAALHELQQRWPDLMQLEQFGSSYEGRPLWVATLTQQATGPAQHKPAFWVDGNLHAAELVGSSACLFFIQRLLTHYGLDADITRCLDTRVFYVCARVNPDGAEWALQPVPKIVRSSTRPYPYADVTDDGLHVEDVDNDGRILTMRIPDTNGAWKKSPQQPRLLVPREPDETGGEYFRLLPEGRIHNFDGVLIAPQTRREALDLNRNFPAQWREEHQQKGAGPYPVSEPEVRAVVDFIARHTNICGGVTFHSYSGALLRPFSYQPDDKFAAEDLWIYQTIGKKGSDLTGYPAVSVYHEFRYHPNDVITGALDDWMYEFRGVFAWTVEIWSPQRQAGIRDYKLYDWYRTHPHEDDIALLRWSDEQLNGAGFVDWYPFEHPQLGRIELGGWNGLFTFWNPPPALLEREVALFPRWLVWHNLIGPKLELLRCEATPVGDGVYKIVLSVHNTGWLPSYVTKQAHGKQLCRGVTAEITLPTNTTLLSSNARIELTQLEGRAYKNSSPTGWAAGVSDPTSDRAKAEWLVRAEPGCVITVEAWHDRAGRVRHTLII